MNWIVISNAYGKFDDDEYPIFEYDAARKYALGINSQIDWQRDKAYREVACIVGWIWQETGDRVYDDDQLRLHSTQNMDYYEVPMPDRVSYTEYPEEY